MKLGTYTTIDCPTDKVEEAENFLKERFDLIQGNVRKVYNAHDFAPYPSFEIDFPKDLESLEEEENLSEEQMDKLAEKEAWIATARNIQEEYNKKFEKYL
jgi:hypothetical protein